MQFILPDATCCTLNYLRRHTHTRARERNSNRINSRKTINICAPLYSNTNANAHKHSPYLLCFSLSCWLVLVRSLPQQHLVVYRTLVQRSSHAVAQMFCRACCFQKHHSSVNKPECTEWKIYLNAFAVSPYSLFAVVLFLKLGQLLASGLHKCISCAI